ncbi:hypothetical protein BRADI_1g76105v3 [Brachypodium distachyon]|uniref:RNase H type-1 domain-containing protein n=1 Tax=Brachypodium distachyon TaxID=15368 RepID=A0A2K2DVE7_BRADI|nr:hypothetical protein BRADI_1g76105v3 [Brachypodium distachyon]
MRIFNQALLARQAWRLLQCPDSLCARMLKAKYYPNGNLIDTVFTGNPSSTWSAISYGLELLKKGIIWRVGNGRHIRIWRDNWIPRHMALKVVSNQGRCRLWWVSDLLDENGGWRQELVRRIFLPADSDAILRIKTSPRLAPDFLAWHPEKMGSFSVRSAYRLGVDSSKLTNDRTATSSHPDGSDPCWNKIWTCIAPPKVKIFAWKAANNALATEENKKRRGMEHKLPCQPTAPKLFKRWVLPMSGWAKLNVDGSVQQNPNAAGVGMILRGDAGAIIFSACRTLDHCTDPFEAELCACMEGLGLALEWCQLPIIVETDCTAVVEAGDRSQNRASHTLANLSRMENRTFVWPGSAPPSVVEVVLQDVMP